MTSRRRRCYVPVSSAGVLFAWRAKERGLALYGFGAAAHIIAQVARWQGREVFAFTRPGDLPRNDSQGNWVPPGREAPTKCRQDLSIALSSMLRSERLVPAALRSVRKGGRVVCAGIHMSDIPTFPLQVAMGGAADHFRRKL